MSSYIGVNNLITSVDKFNHIYDTLFSYMLTTFGTVVKNGLLILYDGTEPYDYLFYHTLSPVVNPNIVLYYSADGFFDKINTTLNLTHLINNDNKLFLILFVLGFDINGTEIPKILYIPIQSDELYDTFSFDIVKILKMGEFQTYVSQSITDNSIKIKLQQVISYLNTLGNQWSTNDILLSKLYDIISDRVTLDLISDYFIDYYISKINKQNIADTFIKRFKTQIVDIIFNEYNIQKTYLTDSYTICSYYNDVISQQIFKDININNNNFYYIGLKTNYDIMQLNNKYGIIYLIPMYIATTTEYQLKQHILIKNEFNQIIGEQYNTIDTKLLFMRQLSDNIMPRW